MASILIIDDDPVIRALVSSSLEAQGHSVIEAADGQAGVKAFDRARIELVVTDIVMPVQEGIETIGAIRRLSPTVPILAISGSRTVGRYGDYLHAAAVLGATATLPKPFSAESLIEVIDGLLPPRK